MKLKVKAVSPRIGRDLPWPSRATEGSAGMDLCACIEEDRIIAPRQLVKIPTGIAIALPGPEYVALVYARSGLGIRHGVSLSNGVGVIDSDYRGELVVPLRNFGDGAYTIQPGERIAQLVIMPVLLPEIVEVEELSQTQRGQGGFGSTGR